MKNPLSCPFLIKLFADFGGMKLDKKSFSEPIHKMAEVATGCQGSFGKVLKRMINDPVVMICIMLCIRCLSHMGSVFAQLYGAEVCVHYM